MTLYKKNEILFRERQQFFDKVGELNKELNAAKKYNELIQSKRNHARQESFEKIKELTNELDIATEERRCIEKKLLSSKQQHLEEKQKTYRRNKHPQTRKRGASYQT